MSLTSFSYADLKEINYKDFAMRLYNKAFDEEDLLSNAAQVAYFFLFALFPLLLFLVSIFGIVLESAGDLKAEMFLYLRQAMPGSAYELVQKTIEEVTESSTGGKLTFGILIALYSASAGIDGIRTALNGIYNLTEDRPWWKTKLTSLLMTLGLGILITIALGVIFYGSKFVTLILDTINLPINSPIVLGILQGAIVLFVLIVIFALQYNYLPRHKKPKWVWVTPGTIIGIVLWLLLSYSFRLYLSYFNTYDKTYGSLGAVIILMLWLYLTALVILIGGAINAVLQEFTDPRAAKAGANKAAAKVLVENPELNKAARAKAVADKKAETLATLSKTNDGNDIETENAGSDTQTEKDNPKKISDDSDNGAKPKVEKSKLKLIAGLLIGFVSNLRKK
jgi:membrane protein